MAEIPTVDRRWREIGTIYEDARVRLERLVRLALERGATGTAAYRQEQLHAVLGALATLQAKAVPIAVEAVDEAYRLGATATDAVLGGPGFHFSGVHQRAVEVLADNLVNRLNGAAVTVGRRTEDAFRTIGLKEVAAGIATGAGPRDVAAALERRLVDEGVTDALTGFVASDGTRWQLDVYAEMVARTTTREAVSSGTANRLLEVGDLLVTISAHANSCVICLPFQGNTYALPGHRVEGYETLDRLPPFHPNCRHVLAPARANLEAFERELGIAA